MQKNLFFSLMLLMSGAASASDYPEKEGSVMTDSDSVRSSSLEVLLGAETDESLSVSDDEGDEEEMSALERIDEALEKREKNMTELEERVKALQKGIELLNERKALNNASALGEKIS